MCSRRGAQNEVPFWLRFETGKSEFYPGKTSGFFKRVQPSDQIAVKSGPMIWFKTNRLVNSDADEILVFWLGLDWPPENSYPSLQLPNRSYAACFELGPRCPEQVAAADFHSKGGEIQGDVRELMEGHDSEEP